MIPIVLVSPHPQPTRQFIEDCIKKYTIPPHHIFEIEPKNKEFSIDQIREIQHNVKYHMSSVHLYVLYNFHTASFSAQNAFLKTLEEPQEHAQFILVVDMLYTLLPTVLSRTTIIQLKKDKDRQINPHIAQELEKYMENKDLQILANKDIQNQIENDVSSFLTQIIYFFRKKLVTNPRFGAVIKKILYLKTRIERNNIDPRMAVDSLFLEIKKLGEKPKK